MKTFIPDIGKTLCRATSSEKHKEKPLNNNNVKQLTSYGVRYDETYLEKSFGVLFINNKAIRDIQFFKITIRGDFE